MESDLKLSYGLTQCYLEVARGAMMSVHHPSLTQKEFLETLGPNPLANAIFSLVSISVLYSYLAIESFINYQLYCVWERRNDGSEESNRFSAIFGNVAAFEAIKTHKKSGKLGERIKTLCGILGYQKPHDAIPNVWQDFKELVEVSRYFFVHPHPGKEHFQNHMGRIFTNSQAGKYAHVAEGLLKYLYRCSGKNPPDWLDRNRLLQFRGIDILLDPQGEEKGVA
jgi:hypothetical protein